jgi:predicted nuclease of restriction endonuclease-like (RecB) superfamily
MKSFAQTYPNEEIVKQLASQIPWGHNIRIIQTIKDQDERLWYIQKTIENGWSRNVLVHQIESDLYNRQGRAMTNFEKTLPAPQSELARQVLKDPYIFDFLTLEDKVVERQLERALVEHIRDFLLELGVGFAFVGSQYHLEVGDDDFYIDLLFYHLKLRSYVVIDLKVGDFKPEYAGKMNFYLSAVDDILRNELDNPSIGIVLCKDRKKLTVEYALRDIGKPIGVPTYELEMISKLPPDLEGKLPTVEQLEAELAASEPEHEEAGD